MPRFKLHRVVHRRPVAYRPHENVPEYLLAYCVETLDCGHKLSVYPAADPLIARYRKCPDCDQKVLELPPKKPVQSASLGEEFSRKKVNGTEG